VSQNLPVAVFAYNRPAHLARCLSDLASNPESANAHVRVYIDGPKDDLGRAITEDVAEVAMKDYGFAVSEVVVRNENLGLATSVIAGVSEMTEQFGQAILVEDDLQLSPHFLRYMRDGLNVYRDAEHVFSIHGYSYPVRDPLPETFFLRGADCWGWATWRRAWTSFESDAGALADRLEAEGLACEFDMDGAYPYMEMLRASAAGKNDSWAVRWHASAYLRNGLTLYPGRSLVWNAGLDGSGTHSGDLELHPWLVSGTPVVVEPIAVCESAYARAVFAQYLRAMRRRRLVQRVGRSAWRIQKKIRRIL
jgi:hypothetical protein